MRYLHDLTVDSDMNLYLIIFDLYVIFDLYDGKKGFDRCFDELFTFTGAFGDAYMRTNLISYD